jgi:hypothetical protein
MTGGKPCSAEEIPSCQPGKMPFGSWGRRLRDVQFTHADCPENRAGYSDITKQRGAGRESGKSVRIRINKSALTLLGEMLANGQPLKAS